MKRRVALTNEAARHPTRRMFPPPATPKQKAWRSGDDDVKLFFLSFTAFFICFYTMIA